MHGEEENAVATWMEERDRLVEQTRAFVAGVAAAAAPAQGPADVQEKAAGPTAPAEATVAPYPDNAVKPIQAPHIARKLKPAAAVSERAEISQRVAAFQAHQSRVSREREAFYEATQSKIRDVLGNEIKPTPL